VSSSATFIVDASSWICLYEERYSPDLFPAMWTELRRLAEEGRIRVPREAIGEVGQKDSAASWLRSIQPSVVPSALPSVLNQLRRIATTYPGLVADYVKNADAWLVAFGKHHGWTVVTEEGWSNNNAKPKINDVCAAEDVTCINCTEMLRQLGVRWGDPLPRPPPKSTRRQKR
jgi:hypothetical protein